jgi:hypothetical protein
MGPQSSYGGLLDEDAQKAARSQGLLAMGAQLMQGGGVTPQRTTFGQALGPALMAGQQSQMQQIDASLNAALLKAQIEKAKEAKKPATRTHVVGNTLVDDEGKVIYQGAALDSTYGRINPGDYTPASLAKYAETKNWADLERTWAPPSPTVVNIGGAPNLVQGDRNTGGVARSTPLSTQDIEIDAVKRRAEEEAKAKAKGAVVGEQLGGIEKKAAGAQNVNDILDLAEPLFDKATGSSVGSAVDKGAAMIGQSTEGGEAAARLKILQAALMFAQPRMEGPQGVLDVKLYEVAAGQIGDPTVPSAIKRAASKTIRDLQEKYKAAGSQAEPGDKKRSRADILKEYGL